jgi:hypothetical protein
VGIPVQLIAALGRPITQPETLLAGEICLALQYAADGARTAFHHLLVSRETIEFAIACVRPPAHGFENQRRRPAVIGRIPPRPNRAYATPRKIEGSHDLSGAA